MSSQNLRSKSVAIIGAGPAGLFAAQALSQRSQAMGGPEIKVDIYEAMPSPGRKFLLAGRGGLNLTHSEDIDPFKSRYFERSVEVSTWLTQFGPVDLRQWTQSLGIETFVGSSGRVFPREMKASPLLRAWLRRLDSLGVRIHYKHRFTKVHEVMPSEASNPMNFDLETPKGRKTVQADALIMAMGGASWARLGSDGQWVDAVKQLGVDVKKFDPANCGFDSLKPWTAHLKENFAGQPIKPVALTFEGVKQQGEFVLTESGLEGSLIYAFSAAIRKTIEREGSAKIELDLLPDTSLPQLANALGMAKPGKSLSTLLKTKFKLSPLKVALLYELLPKETMQNPAELAAGMKSLPIVLARPRPIDEAISSAGGVMLESLNESLEAKDFPGVFFAGEMLDWEAPTGGYLLTACFASANLAAQGVLLRLGCA